MKNYFAKITLYVALLFLAVNCASSKKSKTIAALKKGVISENKEIYIPRIKSERTTFFKDSDAETKWVDSIYNKMSVK